jgi:hypothetical protein
MASPFRNHYPRIEYVSSVLGRNGTLVLPHFPSPQLLAFGYASMGWGLVEWVRDGFEIGWR